MFRDQSLQLGVAGPDGGSLCSAAASEVLASHWSLLSILASHWSTLASAAASDGLDVLDSSDPASAAAAGLVFSDACCTGLNILQTWSPD